MFCRVLPSWAQCYCVFTEFHSLLLGLDEFDRVGKNVPLISFSFFVAVVVVLCFVTFGTNKIRSNPVDRMEGDADQLERTGFFLAPPPKHSDVPLSNRKENPVKPDETQ